MIEVVCPVCGTDDHLHGTPVGEVILLRCAKCDVAWERDPRPSCPTCGGIDMVCVPEVLVERSRGTQLSITGIQPYYRCRVCDAAELAKPRGGHLPDALGGRTLGS